MAQKKERAFVLTTSTCTGASKVTNASVAYMQFVGESYLASMSPPAETVFYYNIMIDFIANISLGLGILEGRPISLWDAVTALIMMGK